jgi:hypothetical protein
MDLLVCLSQHTTSKAKQSKDKRAKAFVIFIGHNSRGDKSGDHEADISGSSGIYCPKRRRGLRHITK